MSKTCDHKFVEVETIDDFFRYCYKCKDHELYIADVWVPTERKLFK